MITENKFSEIAKNHLKVRNDGSTYIDDPKLAKQYAEYLDAQNATKGKKGKVSAALAGSNPSCPKLINSADNCGCPNANCDNGQCINPDCGNDKCPDANCPNPSCPNQCPNDSCVNATCPDAACPNGVCPNPNCPDANCPNATCPNNCPNHTCIDVSCSNPGCQNPNCVDASCPNATCPNYALSGYDLELLISGDGLKSVFQQLFELQAFPNQVIIENFKLDISEPTDLTIITNDPKNIDIEVTIPIKVNSTDDDEGIMMSVPVPVAAYFSFTQNSDNTIALVLIDIDISSLPSGLFDKNKIIDEINLDLDVISSTISTQALSTFNEFNLKKFAATGNSPAAYGIYINVKLDRCTPPSTVKPVRPFNIDNAVNFLNAKSHFAIGCPSTFFTDLLTDYCNNNLTINIPQIDYPGPWEYTAIKKDGNTHHVTIKKFIITFGNSVNPPYYYNGNYIPSDQPSIMIEFDLHVGDVSFLNVGVDVNYYATVTPDIRQGQLLLAFTSTIDDTVVSADVKNSVDEIINNMFNEVNPLINSYAIGNPIKLSPFSTLRQFFLLPSYQFSLSNTYQSCLVNAEGFSVSGKVDFTSRQISPPTLPNNGCPPPHNDVCGCPNPKC